MKGLALAAGIAMLAIPYSGAAAAIISLGGPLSRSCYESALYGESDQQALNGCDRALSEEPLTREDRAATYVNRGIVRMDRDNFVEAASDFDSALSIDKSLADAWLNKGFLRLRQGNGREAVSLINEGLSHHPDRLAIAYLGRGLAYEDLGDFKAAYADLNRARDLEPGWKLPGQYLARYRVEQR